MGQALDEIRSGETSAIDRYCVGQLKTIFQLQLSRLPFCFCDGGGTIGVKAEGMCRNMPRYYHLGIYYLEGSGQPFRHSLP